VQVHFVDPKNKPVDIIHHLKVCTLLILLMLQLDKSLSGLQTLGTETPVDVELDRHFFETKKATVESTSDSTTKQTTEDVTRTVICHG
jgi:hypothetical protein